MQDSNSKPKRLSGLSSVSDSAALIIHELNPSNMTPSDALESSSGHSLPLQNPSSLQTDSKKENSLEEEKNPFETEPRGEATSLERPQEPVHLDIIQREPEMNRPEEIVPSQSLQENNDSTPNPEASQNEEEIARNLHLVLKRLAWFKVWRALVIYLITLTGSVFLSLLREGKIKSNVSVYILAYIFLTYYLTENIVKMLSHDILPWKKMENTFNMINTSIIIIFLIFVQLRFSGINIQTKWVPLVYLLNLIVYAFKTQAPDIHKQYQISKRIIIFIQLFILAVNIDGNAGWPWIVCVWLVILCLIFAAIFFVVILTLLIYVIIAPLLNRVVFASIRKSTLILGFLWSILNSSLGISVMTGILASAIDVDYETNVPGSIINVCLLTVKILDILLIVLTVPAHNYILDYLVCLDVEKPLYEEQLTPLERIQETSTFAREKKTTYFVKLSSTYFSPLNISFARKSDVLKKLNRTVNKPKNRRFQRSLINPEDSVNQDLKLDESISIQDLRKEKSRDKETSNKGQAFPREKKQDLGNQNKINPPKEYHQKQFLSDEDRQKPVLSMADIKKVCFSEDLEAQGLSEEVRAKSSENMCYICFEKIPDAIFAECGHGGICIHCALEIVHIKGQCMQCRRDVGKVIRIEPNAQLKDIVKGYETLTIVPNK